MLSIAAFALVSVLAASAADIQVNVGANNQLIFDPNNVAAQPGDSIHFQFQSKNHSVTQSSFATPCQRLPSGIDSGFMPVNASATSQPVWTFQVTGTTPLWFFCAQTAPAVHCTNGMVFAVNPTADKTFQQFQSAANGTASASNGTSASGAASVNPTDVTPAPTTLPGAAGSGAAATPAQGGLTTGAGAATTAGTGTAGSASTTTSSSNSTNGAVGLSSAGAFSLVPMFAAVAGFML